MDIRTTQASAAYAQTRAALRTGALPDPAAAQAGGGGPLAAAEAGLASFGAVLRQGEETARAAMTGGADMHAVVQALAASQIAVETTVTLRDKVVQAYHEILAMQV